MEPSRHRAPTLLAGLAILAASAVAAGVFHHQVNDDAFITFRYADRLATGQGATYNDGEHVEGYTNFLTMMLSSLWHVVAPKQVPESDIPIAGTSILWFARIFGYVCAAGASLLAWLVTRRMLMTDSPSHAQYAWIAGVLVAVQTCFAQNATTGLETSLYAVMLVAAVASTYMRHPVLSIAAPALVLIRPEGLAAALIITGFTWWVERSRRNLIQIVAVLTVFAALTGFRFFYYDGEFVPNTYFAKQEGIANTTAGAYLSDFLTAHLGPPTWVALAVLILLVVRRRFVQTEWSRLSLVMLMTAWSVLAVLMTGADWMPGFRLLAPYVPIHVILLAGVLATVFHARHFMLGMVLLCAWSVIWQTPYRSGLRERLMIRAIGYEEGHYELARWLSAHGEPDDCVALMDIGIIGYVCDDMRVLDITGLTDRTIAKSPGRFLAKQFDPAYVFDQAPRFLVITLFASQAIERPADFEQLKPFTLIEDQLVQHPAFVSMYVRPSESDTSDLNDRLAQITGARRAFRHAYPGGSYFLLVYERGDS